ncbi:MAG: HEPN domain-containing protein [Spirochaetota bacterium]
MPRKTDSNNPADWLLIAGEELAGVKHLISEKIAYAMCASKLAEILEKTLKAELIRTGWQLIKIHDLVKLADELRSRDPLLADRVQALCESLAEKYIIGRYPGFDREEENWNEIRVQADEVAHFLSDIQGRIATKR